MQDRIVLWSSKDIPRKLSVEKAKDTKQNQQKKASVDIYRIEPEEKGLIQPLQKKTLVPGIDPAYAP